MQVHTYLNKYSAHPSTSVPKGGLAKLNQLYEAAVKAACDQGAYISGPEVQQFSSSARRLAFIQCVLAVGHVQCKPFL